MKTAILALALAPYLHAESAWHKWLRRSTSIASCAVSAYDGYQTANPPRGTTEANPLLRGRNGHARIGPMIAIKAGMCGPAFIAEWKHGRAWEDWALAGSTATLGVFTFTTMRNARVQ